MALPFSPEQFFAVFRRYNESVWPAQLALSGVGLLAAFFAFRPRPGSDRVVNAILVLLWAWMGGVYHLHFFLPINRGALLFGALFLLEAGLLLWMGVVHSRLTYRAPRTVRGLAGGGLLVCAFVIYPLLARSFGHEYPSTATFGLPCPTTIATLGLFLWAQPAPPASVTAIPLLWAGVGTSAAVLLGVREDFVLGLAGLVALGCLAIRGPVGPGGPTS
jgi:hypothetical protein